MRHIQETFQLPHVSDAFALSATGTVVGKISISISNDTSVKKSDSGEACPAMYFTRAQDCLSGKARATTHYGTDAAAQCCAACRVPGWITEEAECSGWRLLPDGNGSGTCALFAGKTSPAPPPSGSSSCIAMTKHVPPPPPPPPRPQPCAQPQPAVAWPPYEFELATDQGSEQVLSLDMCSIRQTGKLRQAQCDFWQSQSALVPPPA